MTVAIDKEKSGKNMDESFTVVVVEDDKMLNQLVQRVLNRHGFKTKGVFTGKEFSELDLDPYKTILLLDHHLPDMTSKEISESLIKQNSPIPFIIMTGYGDERLAVEMMKLGAKDYLIKDSHFIDQLPSVVSRILEDFIQQIKLIETEIALRESEERFRHIIENTEAGYFFIDMDQCYQNVNQAWLKMHKFSSLDEIIGQHFSLTQLEEDQNQIEAIIDRLFKGESIPYLEISRCCQDGSKGYHTLSAHPVKKAGVIIGVEGFLIDITEHKKAEMKINSMQKYLKNIIDSMPSLLVGVDGDYLISQWNAEVEKNIGFSKEDVMGKSIFKILPEFASEFEKISQSIKEQKPYIVKKVLIERRGQRQYWDIMIYPLIAEGIEGAVIRMDDVSSRVRIEDMVIQTEKMMSIGGLAAGMAHEINNPLGGILQSAQNIQRRVSPGIAKNREIAGQLGIDLTVIRCYLEEREILKFIDDIQESGKKASKIVSNMLQFSRPAYPQIDLSDIHEIINRTLELAENDYNLKMKYNFKKIDIERNFDVKIPLIPLDRMEIEQVLLNIIKNAAYAVNKNTGNKTPRIVFRSYLENNRVCVEIEDNGHGMTEEIRKRIFEPFFTTKDVGTGTGLGLTVSYMIITNSHKGSIYVESAPDEGAKFIVSLPIL